MTVHNDPATGSGGLGPLSRNATYSARTESVLRSMILDGELAPGERLNEVALANTLGISRGPLREAVRRLASEGLLTLVSHRGAFVRTFSRDEIVELYEVRAALELHAVRLVCQRADDGDIAELQAMLDETESRMSRDRNHAYPQELDFHLRLVLLVGNQALMDAALASHHQISLARSISAKQPLRARAAVVEHHELVDAVQARDVHTATDLMDRHIGHSRDSALTALGLPTESREDL
jgi:DNA-binding GntR family transcriptional regulator